MLGGRFASSVPTFSFRTSSSTDSVRRLAIAVDTNRILTIPA